MNIKIGGNDKRLIKLVKTTLKKFTKNTRTFQILILESDNYQFFFV